MDDLFEFIHIVCHTRTASGKGIGCPDDQRKSNLLGSIKCLVHIVGVLGDRQVHTDLDHRLFECLSVFAFFDSSRVRTEKLHTFEHPFFMHTHGNVECCLSSHGRQDGIDILFLDDLLDHLFIDRFNIGSVCELRVCHDGCRVGVDEYHTVAELFECLCSLCT